MKKGWVKSVSLTLAASLFLAFAGCSSGETGAAVSKEETAAVENGSAEDSSAAAENGSAKDDSAAAKEAAFTFWDKDAEALNVLVDYVEEVTDESSENYIPEKDRIAVFDMDGTLYAELFPTYIEYYAFTWRVLADPDYNETDPEVIKTAETIRDSALDNSYPESMPMDHALAAAKAYEGLGLDDFDAFVKKILDRDADGFEGMTYGEAGYLPMTEIIDYLNDNDFTCYVVSGSDRSLCRTLLDGIFDVPTENIIGMDVAFKATGQGDTSGVDYVLTEEDEIIRSDTLLVKDIKMNKVSQIAMDIGKQPVLSFGNTSGDVSMHNYTLFHNKYRSEAFMLIADDEERDYGNTEKAEEKAKEWKDRGYNVISMKNDFKTIYGDNVKKTGTFRWEEEFAESKEKAAEKSAETGIDYKVLVNKLYALPDDWEEKLETVHVTNSVGDDVEVEVKTYEAYLKLKEDLEKDGIYIDMDSARRTVAEQQKIMDDFTEKYGEAYAKKTVAQPGHSEHHTGLAVDLYLIVNGKDVTENEDLVQYPQIWEKIHERLADYGFILRYLEDKEHVTGYGYEPWHIRYIDDEKTAAEIMGEGVTLEGYLGTAVDTKVVIDYGTSEAFTLDELVEAAIQIKCNFAAWKGCELYRLTYCGDEENMEETVAWLNSLNEGANYVKAAEFRMDLHTSPAGNEGLAPNKEVKDYPWWLGLTEDGDWEVAKYGDGE